MADYNATDTTEDGQRKQVHSENEIRRPSLMGSNKDQGEVGTGNSTKQVSGKWKRGRSATKHKKAKKSNKNKHSKNKRRYRSTSSSSSIEKSSPSPKGINLEERNASIASVHLLHLIHHRCLLPRILQMQEVEKGRWVADSKLYLKKISLDAISPMTWPNMPIQILKHM